MSDHKKIKPEIYISELVFNSGISLKLKDNEKIIIVGPNNSGKSQVLRDVLALSSQKEGVDKTVVSDLEITKSITSGQLLKYFEQNGEYTYPYFNIGASKVHSGYISQWGTKYLNGELTDAFVKNITTKGRLEICEQQNSIDPGKPKTQPQHLLYDDDELRKKISLLFKKAFNKDLFFDFRGGSKIPIHIGEEPTGGGFVDRQDNKYRDAVRLQPLLDKQGDGVKGFAGILFETLTYEHNIILLDEPEAFLHPPQMRKLGQILSSESNAQMLVATHSSDVMRGFLEGTKGDVRIIRIHRDNNINIIHEADSDAIKELWNKPNLKYSNALDGIFHEQVIICEDDSDCKLYNYTADFLEIQNQEQWLDTAYIPATGKSAIPGIASVLRKTGVPTKAIFDIDFLSEEKLLTDTVVAFGGETEEIIKIWKRIDANVRQGIKPKSADEINKDIIEICQSSNGGELKKSAITEALKMGKAWNIVKQMGETAIPGGETLINYNRLIELLSDIGIYVVPVGEIENFNREISGHGPKYVNKVLTEHTLTDPKFSALKIFVEKFHKGNHSRL